MTLRHSLRYRLRKFGFDVVRYDYMHHEEARRINLISTYGITVILDVGANTGQYAAHLRELGFARRIISFEPLRDEYATLESRAAKDALWETRNYALGDADVQKDINVAANSHSSSLLSVLKRHLDSAPAAQAIDRQRIEVRRLDSVFDELCMADDVPYLKIDTQGYEMRILEGAAAVLHRIDTVQLELSLTPLYQDDTGLPEMVTWLYDHGFVLVSLEPGHADSRTGQLLQVDGIFHRFRES